jgi:8-oxo-dGTP diphosphatase
MDRDKLRRGTYLDSLPLPQPTLENKVVIRPANSLTNYKVVNIFAKYEGQWLYVRAKGRDVYEMPGGGVHPGETALEAAKRELWEETGATEFDIEPAFDFIGLMPHGEIWNGQTFYARIKTLGGLPDYEMDEVKLFNGLPDNMRFADVTEILYRRMQGWLNVQASGNELWDVYDANRKLTGRLHKRSDPLKPGDYHLCVLARLKNTRGESLLTKRAPEQGYGGMWENTGGSALSGDDSLTAAASEEAVCRGLLGF